MYYWYYFGEYEEIDRYDKLVEIVDSLAKNNITYPKFYLRIILNTDDLETRKKYVRRLDKLLRNYGYVLSYDLMKGLEEGLY